MFTSGLIKLIDHGETASIEGPSGGASFNKGLDAKVVSPVVHDQFNLLQRRDSVACLRKAVDLGWLTGEVDERSSGEIMAQISAGIELAQALRQTNGDRRARMKAKREAA